MTCSRCADLEEEIAYLKSELGLRDDADQIEALREGLDVATAEAHFLRALYNAKGRTVSHMALLDAIPARMPDRDHSIVKVYASRVRARLGPGSIENIWGVGYRLSEEALIRVSAVLNPIQLRAAS